MKKSLFSLSIIFSIILLSLSIVSSWQLVAESENAADGEDYEDALMCDDGYIAVGLILDNGQEEEGDDGYVSINDGIKHTKLICAKYVVTNDSFSVDYGETEEYGVGSNIAKLICPEGNVMVGIVGKDAYIQTGTWPFYSCTSVTWVDAYVPICAPYNEKGEINYDDENMLPNSDFTEKDGKCDQTNQPFKESQKCQEGEIAIGLKETLVKKKLKKWMFNQDRTVSTYATVICQEYAGGSISAPVQNCIERGYTCENSCDITNNKTEIEEFVCDDESKKCCREIRSCSSKELTLLKLSDAKNAHASLFSEENTNPINLCYSDIFEKEYIEMNPHDCSTTINNTIVYLDKSDNSHGSFEKTEKYNIPVCYGNLNCRTVATADEGGCSDNEKPIISLTQSPNGMFAIGNTYNLTRCCKIGTEELVITTGCGTDNEVNGQEECDFIGGLDSNTASMPLDISGTPIIECSQWDSNIYTTGTINCSLPGSDNECRLDFSGCTGKYPSGGICGDEIINDGERCDGKNLSGMNCGNFHRAGVGLRCSSDCKSFDFTYCVNCDVNKTLCSDGSCKESCGTAMNCDNNMTCDIGEGCECGDCHGYRDSCINSTICDFKTKQCQTCPNALSYIESINPVYSTCSFLPEDDPGYMTIEITNPKKGNEYESWPKFKVGEIISFNQTINSTKKDVKITWNFGDESSERIIEKTNCLTGEDCNVNHAYSTPGHYIVEAKIKEIGGNQERSDFIDILIYQVGYNPFAIISKPTNGYIFEKSYAEFEANKSVVVKCDESCSSSSCIPVGINPPILQCYDLKKPGESGAESYNFWFEWTFDKETENAEVLTGTWNENYTEVVVFGRSFLTEGGHTASLRVGYEAN
ncbi:MAG TPA: PKD domain-containing protein [Candidatus Paceibacterota bacterium]|nr:PKD domain-containing protein [Candidatus Paceibacterota bacterium]